MVIYYTTVIVTSSFPCFQQQSSLNLRYCFISALKREAVKCKNLFAYFQSYEKQLRDANKTIKKLEEDKELVRLDMGSR